MGQVVDRGETPGGKIGRAGLFPLRAGCGGHAVAVFQLATDRELIALADLVGEVFVEPSHFYRTCGVLKADRVSSGRAIEDGFVLDEAFDRDFAGRIEADCFTNRHGLRIVDMSSGQEADDVTHRFQSQLRKFFGDLVPDPRQYRNWRGERNLAHWDLTRGFRCIQFCGSG